MEGKTFKLKNGLSIYADLDGHGPLAICLSGFANNNHNFKLLAPHLAHNFRLCMIDARGMGQSDPALAEYTMEDLADDAFEIAMHLGEKEFHVIGISLGGYPSQIMAMKYPQNIKSLTIIASRGPGHAYEIIKPVTAEGFTAFMI